MGALHDSHAAFAAAYTARHPHARQDILTEVFRRGAGPVKLAGVDFLVVSGDQHLRPLVLEVNTAPGFGYCTPGLDAEQQAYGRTAELVLSWADLNDPDGVAVIAERTVAGETRAHHRALEQRLGRAVRLVGRSHLSDAYVNRETVPPQLVVRGQAVTAGLRHLHTQPWRLVPPGTTGALVNGTEADLQGGRDKVAAARAYRALERAFRYAGIVVPTPRTWILDGPDSVARALGDVDRPFVVLKEPNANSGLGVSFHLVDSLRQHPPTRFPLVLQEVVGPAGAMCSSAGPLHTAHVDGLSYAFDLRVIVASYPHGLTPIMVFARRARAAMDGALDTADAGGLPARLEAVLKTNLLGGTRRTPGFDEDRVLMPDREGWSALGLSEDDLRYSIALAMLAAVAVGQFGRPARRTTEGHVLG